MRATALIHIAPWTILTHRLTRQAPGKPLADAQRQLEDDGYLLVEGLCDCMFVAHLLEVSRDRSGEVMAALGTQTIGIGSAAGFDEVVQRSPGRWDIPISPDEFGVDEHALPWWPLITAVLGEDAEHSFSGVVYSDPGSPAQCLAYRLAPRQCRPSPSPRAQRNDCTP